MATVSLPWKRMLSAEEAADYCGFKTTRQFLAHARSRVPAVSFGSYKRWDRHRLDEWLDLLTVSSTLEMDDMVGKLFNDARGSTKRTPAK
ncbi:hypothetical protein GHV40_14400 [Devosia sp. D6-9]|nr:hypothetical protein GHV40_14400 [Devosia sp. D6-9]